jgi:NAD(P)-dependent dehydrogenase (short-subunit alcohol dehydrogenase family)
VSRQTSKQKVWFITGTSRGFGHHWATAALKRGDRVAATARDPKALDRLVTSYGNSVLALPLDVTDRGAVFEAVNQAHRHFGRLDVIVSNAGYGLLGAVEETSLDDARANFEANVLGTLSVIQAALPLLRAQGSGHILPVSSVGGLVTFPLGGIYQATKFAVEGLAQTLAQEVAAFGIKVTLIEPGPFATDFMSQSSMKYTAPMAEYEPVRRQLAAALAPEMFGDPAATADAIFRAVDAAEPPLHLVLGPLLPMIRQIYADRLASWETWQAVSNAAHGSRARQEETAN